MRLARTFISVLFAATLVLSANPDQKPGNPAERGEPTTSDRPHPEQPSADKPADGVAPRGGELQGVDTLRWSWLRDGILTVTVIIAAIAFLAFIFSVLSTSSSRDASRHPKIR